MQHLGQTLTAAMLQTKVSTKISQFIKFHSVLNVKEHEDGLSAVLYNKIDYPTPCSKGRQKRVGYCRGKYLLFMFKNIGTYSTIFSIFCRFTKGLVCITLMHQLTVHWCSYSCYATIWSSLDSRIYPAFCLDFILNI